MVTVRKVHQPERPGFNEWLANLDLSDKTKDKLASISDRPDILLIGQEMVEILHELNMDDTTLQTALIYPYCEMHHLSQQDVIDAFGEPISKLVQGVRAMDSIRFLHKTYPRVYNDASQVDNLRRMLLSMAEDVRSVVIKLAERICNLRQVKNEDEETRVLAARECANLYAPLANRLGIGQLKWELEDLSFRYLHPDIYKQIATQLDEKRADRQDYIANFVDELQSVLDQHQIKAKVYGRPKHIYSIWKKMQKKRLNFDQLFDIRAVRVIAERLQDCYSVLGVVHAKWKHIPHEFDDYIATPKPNGYQSIHSVILGPQGRTIEIQIRTDQMHQDAELGVAAHWKYKEGGSGAQSSHDQRINWLRKILQWQEDASEDGDLIEELRSQVFDDRVYVFTPKGDVIDLPVGSTPLDFAYYIHSNVGHRCIGAKVSGRIVPFTYELHNGDQIEVLTGNKLNPKRDWMNPSLGYVHTSRARAKIQTWFKKQDRDKNLVAGRDMLDAEVKRAELDGSHLEKAVNRFNMTSLNDLYVAIGAGDVRVGQVINYLQQLIAPEPEIDPRINQKSRNKTKSKEDSVVVQGVGHLMCHLANCCRPLPGDAIQGFITQGRGVSVHREDCDQFSNLMRQHPERQIDVTWVSDIKARFNAQIEVLCADRDGILRDITTVLVNEKITLLGVNSDSDTNKHTARINLRVELSDKALLSRVIERLSGLKGVEYVRRFDH